MSEPAPAGLRRPHPLVMSHKYAQCPQKRPATLPSTCSRTWPRWHPSRPSGPEAPRWKRAVSHAAGPAAQGPGASRQPALPRWPWRPSVCTNVASTRGGTVPVPGGRDSSFNPFLGHTDGAWPGRREHGSGQGRAAHTPACWSLGHEARSGLPTGGWSGHPQPSKGKANPDPQGLPVLGSNFMGRKRPGQPSACSPRSRVPGGPRQSACGHLRQWTAICWH